MQEHPCQVRGQARAPVGRPSRGPALDRRGPVLPARQHVARTNLSAISTLPEASTRTALWAHLPRAARAHLPLHLPPQAALSSSLSSEKERCRVSTGLRRPAPTPRPLLPPGGLCRASPRGALVALTCPDYELSFLFNP